MVVRWLCPKGVDDSDSAPALPQREPGLRSDLSEPGEVVMMLWLSQGSTTLARTSARLGTASLCDHSAASALSVPAPPAGLSVQLPQGCMVTLDACRAPRWYPEAKPLPH